MFNHPFLLSMNFAYENDRRVYFFLEFCKGGSLREVISKKTVITEEMVKFLIA